MTLVNNAKQLIFVAVEGGGNSNIFLFLNPIFGEMIHFDKHIFQLDWFRHQVMDCFGGLSFLRHPNSLKVLSRS